MDLEIGMINTQYLQVKSKLYAAELFANACMKKIQRKDP